MRCFIFIYVRELSATQPFFACQTKTQQNPPFWKMTFIYIDRTFHMTESSDSSSLVEDCDVNGATNSWESLPPKVKKEKFIVLSDNKWACSSLVVEGFRGWRNRKRGTAAMQASHTSTGWCLIRLCCLSKGTVEENTRAPGASASTAPRLEFHLLNVLLFTVLSRSPSLISTRFFFFFFLLPTDATFHLWQREKRGKGQSDGDEKGLGTLERSGGKDEGNCHIWSAARSRNMRCGSTYTLWCVSLWKNKSAGENRKKRQRDEMQDVHFSQEDASLIVTHICPWEWIQTNKKVVSSRLHVSFV